MIEDYIDRYAKRFAQNLRTLRENQQLTQRQLGDQAGLSPAAVSQLEVGQRRPNFVSLLSLVKALGTTPNTLIGVDAGHVRDKVAYAKRCDCKGSSSGPRFISAYASQVFTQVSVSLEIAAKACDECDTPWEEIGEESIP